MGLSHFFCTFSTKLRALYSSNELGVCIVKSNTFGANFTRSLPFWVDVTKAHKTAFMCVDAVKSKYQLLNKYKLLFDLVVHQQQHLHCICQHSNSFNKV
jgi:hypothetical protein